MLPQGPHPALCQDDMRFVLLRHHDKTPFEKGWQTTTNYKADDRRLNWHINNGGNYGAITGGDSNLIVIDSDEPEIRYAVERSLPATFTVKTGSGRGYHYYYHLTGITNKALLKNTKLVEPMNPDHHLGDLKWSGGQVVAPGSIHPCLKPYEVTIERPIEEISQSNLKMALGDYMYIHRGLILSYDNLSEIKKEQELYARSILSVYNTRNMSLCGDEYRGVHPVHGSSTGKNFCINVRKNTWYCQRCCTGGGPYELMRVLRGEIRCDQVR